MYFPNICKISKCVIVFRKVLTPLFCLPILQVILLNINLIHVNHVFYHIITEMFFNIVNSDIRDCNVKRNTNCFGARRA